jgi:hypothetical protein
MYSALELLHTITFLGRENNKCLIKYEDFLGDITNMFD